MSITNPKTIDFVSVSKSSGRVALTISDHLKWTNCERHLAKLQDKINAYLGYIESGQLHKEHPALVGKEIEISVMFKHAPTAPALEFLHAVQTVIEKAGFTFCYQHSE